MRVANTGRRSADQGNRDRAGGAASCQSAGAEHGDGGIDVVLANAGNADFGRVAEGQTIQGKRARATIASLDNAAVGHRRGGRRGGTRATQGRIGGHCNSGRGIGGTVEVEFASADRRVAGVGGVRGEDLGARAGLGEAHARGGLAQNAGIDRGHTGAGIERQARRAGSQRQVGGAGEAANRRRGDAP